MLIFSFTMLYRAHLPPVRERAEVGRRTLGMVFEGRGCAILVKQLLFFSLFTCDSTPMLKSLTA